MPSPRFDPEAVFRVFARHEVRYIIVGGIGAVLQGALVTTEDLDIVHERTPENIERLLAALRELHARFRARPDLQPDASHLKGVGHALLDTDAGPLDVLGSIGAKRDYSALTGSTLVLVLGELHVRVLDLPTLIATKEEADREKDRAVLPLLRSTLERIRERGDQNGGQPSADLPAPASP